MPLSPPTTTTMRILIPTLLGLTAAALHGTTLFNGSFTENFNTMQPPVGDTLVDRLTMVGSGVLGTQVAIPNLPNWQAARIAGSGTTDVAIWATPSTGGRLYNAGIGTDRALVALASGTVAMGVGIAFTNDTGTVIDAVTLSFTQQIWRVQGTSTQTPIENRLLFAYGTSAAGIAPTNFITNPLMEPRSDFDLVSAAELTILGTTSGDVPDRTRIGSDPEWSTLISGTLSNLNWQPGDMLFLRWNDFDAAGFDAGLGIDNLSLVVVPEPATYALLFGALCLVGVGIRRRR
jgi:trimeric autotransporter adhesin